MIEIKNLCRDWKEFSIKDIDLTICDGEYFVILGPTGTGKTLLLELIAGFYHPDRGEILMDGRDVTALSPEKRNVGFVYQNYSLFPHMNVKKNMEFGMRMKGLKDAQRVKEISDYLHLSHLLHRYPLTLSGGEQQRISLARALLINPYVLLLDEPLSALDPGTKIRTRKMLKQINEDSGITVVHVTHDQTEARVLADRIAVVMDGRIVQVGTPEEVFNRPVNNEVAHFVGVENLLKGTICARDDGISIIDINGTQVEAVSDVDVGRDVDVYLRPESVTLSKTHFKSSARNSFEGRVLEIEPRGALSMVRVDCGFVINALLTGQSVEDLGLLPGGDAIVSFKTAAVHVI